MADMSLTTFGCRYPMTLSPRRIVPNVLMISTFKFRYPIQILVLVKSDNFSRLAFGLASRLHNGLPATNGLILWEFAIATVVGTQHRSKSLCQNCALSVLSVEVSFRAKSRCPKSFEINSEGKQYSGWSCLASLQCSWHSFDTRAKGEFPEFKYERL